MSESSEAGNLPGRDPAASGPTPPPLPPSSAAGGQAPDPVAEALRMRASDADRDRVAEVLGRAYAEGRLTPVEHDERLTEVYRATTYGELAPVLRDLPVPPGTLTVPSTAAALVVPQATVAPTASSESGIAVRPGGTPDSGDTVAAVFSEFTRTGPWTAPPSLNAVCIFGSGKLDYTEATLTSTESIISAVCLFGELQITVPPGVAVRSDAVPVFGEVDLPSDAAGPGAPTLVIKGTAIFGSIKVRRPKPPKRPRSWKALRP